MDYSKFSPHRALTLNCSLAIKQFLQKNVLISFELKPKAFKHHDMFTDVYENKAGTI